MSPRRSNVDAPLRFIIRSDFAEARQVQQRILQELERFDYGEDTRFGVRLWLEEALINAIKHGNQYDDRKTVSIELEVSAGHVTILIRDEGTRNVQRYHFDV